MTDLFKPEDYQKLDVSFLTHHYDYQKIADQSNLLLEERLLSRGVTLYGFKFKDEHNNEEWVMAGRKAYGDTHTMLGIDIKPIEKPKCEKHEPEIFNDQGRFGVYIPYSKPPKCVHCGVNLKAEWREVK